MLEILGPEFHSKKVPKRHKLVDFSKSFVFNLFITNWLFKIIIANRNFLLNVTCQINKKFKPWKSNLLWLIARFKANQSKNYFNKSLVWFIKLLPLKSIFGLKWTFMFFCKLCSIFKKWFNIFFIKKEHIIFRFFAILELGGWGTFDSKRISG